MDESRSRPSGLPRPSRLPQPRPTSVANTPTRPPSSTSVSTSATPRPPSVIRPSPSREGLRTRAAPLPAGELRNPKLRSSTSQSHLRTSSSQSQLRHSSSQSQLRATITNATNTLAEASNPRLRSSASRGQLRGSIGGTPNGQARNGPPVSIHSRVSSISHRQTTPLSEKSLAEHTKAFEEADAAGESTEQTADGDQVLFKRRLTLTRRPSESFTMPPIPDEIAAATENPGSTTLDPTKEEHTEKVTPARPLRPRPSLTERTMETLAQIPSSPALKKKSSAFFDRSRPQSRTERPGSSHSHGSTKASSRPGSSIGQNGNSFSATLDPIDGTPHETPRRGSSAFNARTPASAVPASRITTTAAASSAANGRPASPEKKTYGMLPPTSTPKPTPNRALRPKASGTLLSKKGPSAAIWSLTEPDASKEVSRNSLESGASWDGTIASVPSSSTSMAVSPEPATPSNRKTSAALREHIAKARAAKKSTPKRSPADEVAEIGDEATIIPADSGFDFGMAHEDPFNTRKGGSAGEKVLSQRIAAGRTTGRLNIAALNLKDIPSEVTKMYDLDSVGGGNWAESVDLTRFVAADNEIESLDESLFPDADPETFNADDDAQGSIFAGLENLDLHGNLLLNVPIGFRRLGQLTSLNLSSNRLTNESLDVIAQMKSLRDLKLANNLLFGPLNPNMAGLDTLEILDVHGNNLSALPFKIDQMSRLRILNLNENSFETLAFDGLAKLPLSELSLKKNKLSGTLIEEPIESLPHLQTLDVSVNQLTRVVPLGSSISFPVMHALSLSMNRLQGLPDMTSWTSLLTLTVDENSISSIPNSFTTLEKLRHADFSSNDIRVIPPEIARMDNLSMIRLSGNPLRDKKFVSITTDELKEVLSARLEPPPPYQEDGVKITDVMSAIAGMDAKKAEGPIAGADRTEEDGRSTDLDDDFATPPTSATQSPTRQRSGTASSLVSRSQTNSVWPVKNGGLLDRSKTESSSLHPVICSQVAAENRVATVYLHNNLFSAIPSSLGFFAATLSIVSLAHNQLVGESYLEDELDLPALKELNLASNRITSVAPLTKNLLAPKLEKIDLSLNRISTLSTNLKEAFPSLSILLLSNNHLIELEPEAIKGLKIVEASNNDISHLNPRIGLLGGQGGLQRLDVMGNRFRVPRFNVLERGTDATLRWLRGRVPVSEMAAWRKENDDDSSDGVD